jgi:hypothetical protein
LRTAAAEDYPNASDRCGNPPLAFGPRTVCP